MASWKARSWWKQKPYSPRLIEVPWQHCVVYIVFLITRVVYLREYWGFSWCCFMRRDFDGALSIFERNDCFNIVVVRCGDTHQIEWQIRYLWMTLNSALIFSPLIPIFSLCSFHHIFEFIIGENYNSSISSDGESIPNEPWVLHHSCFGQWVQLFTTYMRPGTFLMAWPPKDHKSFHTS